MFKNLELKNCFHTYIFYFLQLGCNFQLYYTFTHCVLIHSFHKYLLSVYYG